jgi:iron complex outermembrane receptor protein
VRLRWQDRVARDIHVEASVAWDWYAYSGSYPEDSGVSVDSTDTRKLSAGAQASWDLAAAHRLTFGATWERHARADYRAWYAGERWFADDFPYDLWGVYAQHDATLSRVLTVTAGVRHDRGESVSASTTPRVALLWSPSQRRTLKILYGEAFRSPSAYERSFTTPEDFKRPLGLRAEHVRTFEAVWEERLADWLRGELAVYRYDMTDLIDTEVDATDGMSHFVNRDRVEAPGIEAELEARLPAGAGLWVNYAFQDARDGHTGRALSNSPRHLAKAGASVPFGHVLRLTAESGWESRRRTLAGTPSGGALVARTGVRVHAGDALDLWFLADNLFDVERTVPGGYEHVQEALPQPGRALRAGVTVRV